MKYTQVMIVGVAALFIGCGSSDSGSTAGSDGAASGPLEIGGTWDSLWESNFVLSKEIWGPATVVTYDNELNWAVTQNAADDEYNQRKYWDAGWPFYEWNTAFWHKEEHRATYSHAADTLDAWRADRVSSCVGWWW